MYLDIKGSCFSLFFYLSMANLYFTYVKFWVKRNIKEHEKITEGEASHIFNLYINKRYSQKHFPDNKEDSL